MSVAVSVGPLQRMLRLASVRIHTVTGPVTAVAPSLERAEASELFERLADDAIERAATDTSHHWGVIPGSEAVGAR